MLPGQNYGQNACMEKILRALNLFLMILHILMQLIVDLTVSMELDVSDEDVEESVDNHREEFKTEELQGLNLQVQQSAEEEVASDDEGERECDFLKDSLHVGVKYRDLWGKIIQTNLATCLTIVYCY